MWEQFTDDVKAAVDLRALVEETAGPSKGGGRGRTSFYLCPWHADSRTPSLAVYDDHVHCFGCGFHGDAIDWVMRRDSLDFVAARDLLARRAGVARPTLSPEAEAKAKARRAYEDGLGVAAAFFEQELWGRDGEAGLAYVRERGWSDETIRAERLGYAAPGCRERLLKALGAAGVASDDRAALVALKVAGYAWHKGGALVYVHRHRGRVCYLSARAARAGVPKHEAHYNPPERLVDEDGRDRGSLAGARVPYVNALYSARSSTVTVVEGQGDAITLAEWGQAGLALNGTAVDADLGERLQQHRLVYLGLDDDESGRRELAGLAGLVGPMAQVVSWEPAKDANELLQLMRGLNVWRPLDNESANRRISEYVERRLAGSPTWLALQLAGFQTLEGAERDEELEQIVEMYAGLGAFVQARVKRQVCDGLGVGKQELGRLVQAVLERRMMDQPYDIRDGCLCRLDGMRDDGSPNWVPLGNFSYRIVEQVTLDDGQRRSLALAIRGQGQSGRVFPEVTVDASEFSGMNWIVENWGVDAIINVGFSNKEHLRKAGQVLSQGSLRRRDVYAHLGWREVRGRKMFLYHGGAVGADSEVEVQLDDPQLRDYQLPVHPAEMPEAMAASLHFLELAPATVTVPLWAAMFLAPLTPVITPDFMIWIYGKTGTMKSTISALALNHYGSEWAYNKMPASWGDTPAKIEMRAFIAKDVPLILDDFARDVHTARGLDRKAEDTIRRLVNRQGRGRMTSQMTARLDFPPRGLILSTAEQLPQGQSIIGRLMGVEIHPGEIEKEKMTEGQEARHHYGHAMAGYLLWLAEQWDGLRRTLPGQWAELRDRALQESGHLRIPSAIASLYVGLDMALAFFTERGAIVQSDADGWRKVGWDALIALALEQKRLVHEEDPVERFTRIFQALMVQQKVYLVGINGTEDTPHDFQSEQLGFVDASGWVYLLGEPTLTYITEFCRRMGEPYPLNRNAFYKALVDAGVAAVSPAESDSRTWQLRIGEEKHRVLKVRADALGVTARSSGELPRPPEPDL